MIGENVTVKTATAMNDDWRLGLYWLQCLTRSYDCRCSWRRPSSYLTTRNCNNSETYRLCCRRFFQYRDVSANGRERNCLLVRFLLKCNRIYRRRSSPVIGAECSNCPKCTDDITVRAVATHRSLSAVELLVSFAARSFRCLSILTGKIPSVYLSGRI